MWLDEKLKIFTLHFYSTVECILKNCKHILDDEPLENEAKLHPILSAMLDLFLDKFDIKKPSAHSLGKELRRLFDKFKIKKKAYKISKIVYNVHEDKDFRRIVVEGAYDVFCKFELQFTLIHNVGVKKVAVDAANRFFAYLVKNRRDIDDISTETVTKGILLGKSTRNINISPKFFRKGPTLFVYNNNISTHDFFTKPSICTIDNGVITYHKSKNCIPELESRLTFYWEDDMTKYEIVSPQNSSYKYQYLYKDREGEIEILLNYIKERTETSNDAKESKQNIDTRPQDSDQISEHRIILKSNEDMHFGDSNDDCCFLNSPYRGNKLCGLQR